jgi:hypothetical protein
MTVPISFFNNYAPVTETTASVTFNIDMQLPAQGAFDPATGNVFVAGNFTDWGTGAIEMEDTDGDSIYTVTVDDLTSGDLLIYKFIHSASDAASGTWESPEEGDDWFGGDRNRIEGIADTGNVISRFWNNTNPEVQLADGNIYFEVDMSVAAELGVFNPDADSVAIPGAFNGWSTTDPVNSLMNQDPLDPNIWFLDVPLEGQILNGTLIYKYFIKNDPASPQYANTGWEVSIAPTDAGNRDRPVVFEGIPNQTVERQYFDGVHPDWVIPAGTSVEVTWKVDMTYATSPDSQGVNLFVPGTDSVFWIPRHPLYYSVNGLTWPGDYPRVLELTDSDADMIYEGTMTIDGPMFNGYLYNYAFTSNGSLIQEEGAQSELRVRFIGQTGARAFVSPYEMPLDIWSNSPKPEEGDPLTSVEELPGAPQSYSLGQNYPNPFNPSTKIRFTIPEQGLVTLRVYNLLGEEIATLLNTEMSGGIYEVDFDGAKISSGIYFYTITANNFISTKKMLLLK